MMNKGDFMLVARAFASQLHLRGSLRHQTPWCPDSCRKIDAKCNAVTLSGLSMPYELIEGSKSSLDRRLILSFVSS